MNQGALFKSLSHSKYFVLTMNILKTCIFCLFWSLTGFIFQKKLVRQVIELEWPKEYIEPRG